MDLFHTGVLYQNPAVFFDSSKNFSIMNAETILQSDLLDIIFENRNKQYGAYELRKGYNKHLLKAMLAIISIVSFFFVWNFLNNNRNAETNGLPPLTTDTAVHLTKVVLPKEPPPPPKPKQPVASITDPVPVIVPDQNVKDTLHTIDDLADKVISDKNVDGPTSTSGNQTAAPQTPAVSNTIEPLPEAEPLIIEKPEIMPEFPGGTAALLRFLGKNLQVPEDALEPGQRIRVPVKFVVNKEGSLSDVEFLTQTDHVFRKEILRVVAKMPKWKPGSQHGKTVAVYYTIPVIFDMTEN
jgi:periplasmic protein TonB